MRQSDKNIYPHANTIVCIEDSKLLKKFQYDILYNAKGISAALDELNAINYFHTYKNAEARNCGAMLDELTGDTFELLREIAPNDPVFRIFALYYDIHNMKLAVKERFFGKRFDDLALPYGSYSLPTIRSATVKKSDNILDDGILTAGLFEALGSADMYGIDFILDKTYFKTLKSLAGKFGIPEIAEFVTARIDLYNLSAFLQYLAAGAPKGYFAAAFSEEGSFAPGECLRYAENAEPDKPEALEKLVSEFPLWQKYGAALEKTGERERIFYEFDVLGDNYLIEKTKACKLMAFGIEPICAYFYNKFMEIKNIRILLAGKQRGYSIGEIKKRMRIPYEL
ncbi:MAG: V-type ATPase subunit [Oscillospiraceae bacterium]|jgi:V/A-type H+-transporting ATPase subunit C|nr:V-type ATPase subunit [Oscillospiraceae bacterium]